MTYGIPRSVLYPENKHAFVRLIRVLNANPGLKLSPREWATKAKEDSKFLTNSDVTQAANHLNLLQMMGLVVKDRVENTRHYLYTSIGSIPLRDHLK